MDRRALDEEVIPDVGAFQLRPNSIEGHGDEVPLRVDVVAADQQLELPRSRFKHIRLVRRPGVADLDEDRIRAVFLRPVANARQVDDPVRVREDIDGVRFAGQLVRRLQQPTVQFRPRADPPLTARVPLVTCRTRTPTRRAVDRPRLSRRSRTKAAVLPISIRFVTTRSLISSGSDRWRRSRFTRERRPRPSRRGPWQR